MFKNKIDFNLKSKKKKRKNKMTKKCIYCRAEVSSDSVVDFCEHCGKGVWGEKMFNAIIKSMEEARDRGDLCYMRMNPETLEPKKDTSGEKDF